MKDSLGPELGLRTVSWSTLLGLLAGQGGGGGLSVASRAPAHGGG